MRDNKALWLAFGVINQALSWGAIVGYSVFKYGGFIKESGLLVTGIVAFVFAIWLMMRSLKETAEHGYGLMRKIARSVRLAIPLFITLIFVLVVNKNIAGVVDIVTIGVLGNLLAMPFGILSYYAGPQYTEDTSANRILEKL